MSYQIYFNEKEHKYTDEVGNCYISNTTLIGKYEHKFSDKEIQIARACEKIGKNPKHPKYLRYKGKRASQILAEWKKASEDGCAIGNEKHNYLEDSVKYSTNFHSIFGIKHSVIDNKGNVRLYTIEDVIAKPESGVLSLDYFIEKGVKAQYPKIYRIIEIFVNDGWRVYSEVAVFNAEYLISGLIDILLVKDDKFAILDWKTNKAQIMFDAGYWEKDNYGTITKYKITEDTFKYPLDTLPLSVGNKYTLQLSLYAYLVETFGLTHSGNILCHITHDTDEEGLNVVNILKMDYLKNSIEAMIKDYVFVRTGNQTRLFK